MGENFCIPATYLIIQRNDKILLLKRRNTGYEDGNYSFIAGHVEKGESFKDCIIREAKEEAGIEIEQKNLTLLHIMYRKNNNSNEHERVDTFYGVSKWSGDIVNLEPEKCSELMFFDKKNLPQNIIPFLKKVLEHIANKEFFSEYGWKDEEI